MLSNRFHVSREYGFFSHSFEGRLVLPIYDWSRFVVIAAVGIALCLSQQALARDPADAECIFLGVKSGDRVGKTSVGPDGTPDAVFSLSLRPRAGSSRIIEIQITASDPSGLWTTSAQVTGSGFLGVASAKSPSNILNKKGTELNINPKTVPNLLLFVNDDGLFARKDRLYKVRITYSDGATVNAPVKNEAGPASSKSLRDALFSVRMSATLKGISNYDAVNPSKKIGGDDKGDGLFVLSVDAKQREITAIEIRNVDGMESVWDTVPSTSHGVIGVALASDPVKLLNNRNGSVKIPVQERIELNLYVADNGSIEKSNTNFRVTVSFADGEIAWCPVQRQERVKAESISPAGESGLSKVNFLGTWLGYASTDAVGKYHEIKPDGVADALFGLDIEISPRTYITGIEINTLDGSVGHWATGGISPKAWGLGVAYQTAPTALLNKPDGSIRIAVDNRVQFYLYAADPGDIATTTATLRVIVHLADGTSYQQVITRSPSTTSTVAPLGEEALRARGIITCEFRGFIADLVNTSTKPGKDGYLDGTFIMKLQVPDKTLTKVEIKGEEGTVRWSSDPKPPAMFLGVSLYPKIFKLVNEKGGMLHIPVPGRLTVYLYAADNGLLSDPKSRLLITATFSDKTSLSTPVIK